MAHHFRDAGAADDAALAEIYGHYVSTTVVTFDIVEVTPAIMAAKRAAVKESGLPFIVAVDGDERVLGYAAMFPWRPKVAYKQTAEGSIYLSPTATGQGVGGALLNELIERGRQAGIREIIAVISDEGAEASMHLHKKLGFESIGHLKRVGFKFDRWVGTFLMQKSIDA
ncbi:MAG: GNAT family N-acetyltransferase [Rhodoglobus sp.]